MPLGKLYRVPMRERTVTLCPRARVGNEDWFDDDDDQEDDFLEVLDEVDGEANSVATGEADTDTAAALHPEDSVHRAFRSTSVAPPPVLAAPPGAAGVGSAWVIGLGIAAIVVVSAFASKYVRNAWTSRSKRSSDKVRLLGCVLNMKHVPASSAWSRFPGWPSCTRGRKGAS